MRLLPDEQPVGEPGIDAELVARLRTIADWHRASDDAEERAHLRALYFHLAAGKPRRWLGEHDLPHLDFVEAMRPLVEEAAKAAAAMQPLAQIGAAVEAQFAPLKKVAAAVCTATPEEALEIDAGMREWERLPLGERRRWAHWTPLVFSRFRPDRAPLLRSRPHGRRVGRTPRVRRTGRVTRAGPSSPSGSSEPPLSREPRRVAA